ncbi:formylmethanofuran dehydrogenase [Methanoculleus sp. FWC-SCC1]|uniref:Formylmethanofuran dehydrogenase n=1 Tax=Methanoculleus frigidifontis TaxID=2584085 RepID=A0ABT8MDB9_9EURY|nr:FmdE family protein [Methanoculleus sp. FWC-SCC1]MDN7025926.1 formylmethanofuran dehydrogenase [Methanoculleus sp. FWC-SCC1]
MCSPSPDRHDDTPAPAIKPFAEAVRFHGHVCPGLTLGYRAAGIAMQRLCSDRSVDEELVTIVETDACGVDAIQVVTGCTAGKGNLIFRDLGKHAYTFINRRTGEAIRIVTNPSFSADELDPALARLRPRVMGGEATDEERAEFWKRMQAISDTIMAMSEEQLFTIRQVEADIPERARIFRSVPCARCGEMTAESRIRLENGEHVCFTCSGHYSRGW